jgi:hypothetical protein
VACFCAVGIIDTSAQVAYPAQVISPAALYGDPTFGWFIGYLVSDASIIPDGDPLENLMIR